MKQIVISIVICLTAFWIYGGLRDTFFQQDEWLGLGSAFYRQDSGGITKVFYDIFNNPTSRFLPFTSLANYIVFNLFKYNFSWYGYLSIFLAIANAHLVFFFSKKILSSEIFGTLSALFWLSNGMSFQAISWISPVVPSQLSFLFMMVSLNALLLYLSKPSWKLTWSIALILTSSLLFKEIGAFFIVVVPLLSLYKAGWKFVYTHKKEFAIIIGLPLLVAYFIPKLFLPPLSTSTFSNLSDRSNLVSNIITIPTKSLFQAFVPVRPFYELVYYFSRSRYSEITNGYVIETIVGDLVSYLGSALISIAILFCLLFFKRESSRLTIVLFTCTIASCLPFIFFVNSTSILELRFYIFISMWAGLLFASVGCGVTKMLGKNIFWPAKTIIIVLFLSLIYFHAASVNNYIKSDLVVASYRHEILKSLLSIEGELGKDTIWFFYTDNNGFYEYQSGTGQMLAVWFYSTGKIPKSALIDLDLWESGYEGVKKFTDNTYGFFMNKAKLFDYFKENPNTNPNSVHAFYWNQRLHTVTNVSQQIRSEIVAQN